MRATEVFLREFHARNPGCTPAAFAGARTDLGITSYDLLCGMVPKQCARQMTVLDLACGDGHLLSLLEVRQQRNLSLVGVDMSAGELAAARRRLPEEVVLLEARAQSLPIEAHAVDFVLCHLAFMLMGEIELVVAEIERVLKPGGSFSAIVTGKFETSSVYQAFLDLLDAALKREEKSWLSRLGDPRVRQENGIRSIFESSRFERPIDIQDIRLQVSGRPEAVVECFMLMYDVGLLSSAGQVALREQLMTSLRDHAIGGEVSFPMGLRQITCRKVC